MENTSNRDNLEYFSLEKFQTNQFIIFREVMMSSDEGIQSKCLP